MSSTRCSESWMSSCGTAVSTRSSVAPATPPRRREPETVLPGVVDLEAMRVVLDGGHPVPGRFQSRDDLLHEGRLSRVFPPDEAQDGGAETFTPHFAPPARYGYHSVSLSLASRFPAA